MPWVNRMVVDYPSTTVYFDTGDITTISSHSRAFGTLFAQCQASEELTMEFKQFIRKIFQQDRECLNTFFQYTTDLYVQGTLSIDGMEWILPSLRVRHLNIHRWIVKDVGRLASLTRMAFPLECNNF